MSVPSCFALKHADACERARTHRADRTSSSSPAPGSNARRAAPSERLALPGSTPLCTAKQHTCVPDGGGGGTAGECLSFPPPLRVPASRESHPPQGSCSSLCEGGHTASATATGGGPHCRICRSRQRSHWALIEAEATLRRPSSGVSPAARAAFARGASHGLHPAAVACARAQATGRAWSEPLGCHLHTRQVHGRQPLLRLRPAHQPGSAREEGHRVRLRVRD